MQKYGRRVCELKAATGTLSIKTGWLSGVKSVNVDHEGNVFDINYCRLMQTQRQCPKQPDCENYCPIGYKVDNYGCILNSCACKDVEDAGDFVFGDLKLSPEQIKEKLTYENEPDYCKLTNKLLSYKIKGLL